MKNNIIRVPKLTNCARCGGQHKNLEFTQLKRPVAVLVATFTHWALCPKTKEPILLREE